jgi:predicted CopG family antitoxin
MSILAIGIKMTKHVTTVRISTELRDKLKKLGVKGETYEDVIQRLLKMAKKNTGEKS